MTIRLCLASAVLAANVAAQTYEFPPLAPEQNRAQVVKARMLRSGVHRIAPRDFVNHGVWTVENSAPVYRVTVRSPFAHGIRIHFVSFSVGQGRVRVLDLRNWDYTFGGPYTGMGPWDDGEFWSNTVFGDTAVVEYRPADGQRSGEPPFEILEITHQFDLQLDENGIPKTSESCQLDVNCHAEWLPYARAVAVIVFESDGYQNACSGSLIKSRYGSGEGYFLTANHCVGDDTTAKTIEPFWGYRTERCNGAAPDIRVAERVPIGGRLLATGDSVKGDYSLLLLRGLPQNPVFLDWTTEEPKLNDNLVGIHHPRGTGQRISFGQSFVDYWLGNQFTVFPKDKYHQVNWSYGGITEGGSSGSPLFIRPGVLIGVLTYGWDFSYTPPCAVDPKVDGYGKFNAGFPEMRGFLENPKGGLLTFSPKDLNFRALNGKWDNSGKQNVVVTTTSTVPVRFGVVSNAGWLKFSPAEGEVVAGKPVVIEAIINQTLVARPGDYFAEVFLSGSGQESRFGVFAYHNVWRSEVGVVVVPGPVIPRGGEDAHGCAWPFNVALEERKGAATRITLFRINGQDYTSLVPTWFGSDRIEAAGRRDVTLRMCGTPTLFSQLLEVAGVDEGSNEVWSNSVTLEFEKPQ